MCHCFSHAQPGRLRQCAEINGQSSGHRSMHCSNHSLTRRGLPRPWQHLALSTGACCTSATSPGAPATGFLYLFEAAQDHSVLGGPWNLTCTWVKAPGIIDPIGRYILSLAEKQTALNIYTFVFSSFRYTHPKSRHHSPRAMSIRAHCADWPNTRCWADRRASPTTLAYHPVCLSLLYMHFTLLHFLTFRS